MWKLYEVKLTVSIIKVLLEHSHIYCLLLPLLYFKFIYLPAPGLNCGMQNP